MPKRSAKSNKTDAGKVLIVGGRKGLYGAGILAALAATRTGAGYTHLMTDLSIFPWLKFPDFIVHPLKLSELKDKKEFVIGIGPGLGNSTKNLSLIKYLIKNNYSKVVLDADALNTIAANNISPLPHDWILTPHAGEMARLLQCTAKEINADKIKAINSTVMKYQCTVLLKGSQTLIASPDLKKITVLNFKSFSLSKAGTGDVLTGMIASFRAQGLSPIKATILSAELHAKIALEFEKAGNDQLSLRPMDLIDLLPKVIKSLRSS